MEGSWTLELSADGLEWREQPYMSQKLQYSELFSWMIPLLEEEALPTRYIRATADSAGLELGELALVALGEGGGRALMDMALVAAMHPEYAALFDEQSTVPDCPDQDNYTAFMQANGKISGRGGGMYFDESWHAKTAYDFTRNAAPTEITHPPLGKLIMSLGIRLFGMTPFGWRFMGVLFGALMLPLLYALIKSLFGDTAAAACGTALLAFESMHFTQTHVATIDTYAVFFTIARKGRAR